jgi:hypothetical protein
MRTFILALACVLMASASAQLADSVHKVAIGGAGRDTCSEWVTDRGATSGPSQAASQGRNEWVSGFLSGVNLFADRSGHLKGGVDDPKAALEWIDNYCRVHPNDPLWAAAGALVFDLRSHPRET